MSDCEREREWERERGNEKTNICLISIVRSNREGPDGSPHCRDEVSSVEIITSRWE